ncbi:MAG: hypothetical protein WBN68_19320 [Sedimenticolaceae bacterium]
MRPLLKFLHTMGAIGMIGAMASLLILLTFTPEPSSLNEYARIRMAMGGIAEWLLLPSLGLALFSGLWSMGYTASFHNAGWVWAKLALGVVMFEGTLLAVQGPAQREAELSARALAGELDPAELGGAMAAEWGSLWVVLGVATANVVLGVWRPKFSRSAQRR